jgi:hypothetical protein
MTTVEYVDIPACATLLPSDIKVQTSLPPTSNAATTADDPASPSTRTVFGNIPSLLLASSLHIPTILSTTENSRNVSHLMSTRDPLSVPITTVNFRRFISKVGPAFWLQDRIEEIITWRKGWKVTVLWMAIYSFLCQLDLHCTGYHRNTPRRLSPPIDHFTPQHHHSCHNYRIASSTRESRNWFLHNRTSSASTAFSGP